VFNFTLSVAIKLGIAEARPIASIAQFAHKAPDLKGINNKIAIDIEAASHPPPDTRSRAIINIWKLVSTSDHDMPTAIEWYGMNFERNRYIPAKARLSRITNRYKTKDI